jgi:large subunit ribosomal protein L23
MMKSWFDIIKKPILTEKSESAKQSLIYSFMVDRDSNKNTIKKAIENIFSVKVDSVRTINVKGKLKRYKMMEGQRNNQKKAMVTLKEGYRIEI